MSNAKNALASKANIQSNQKDKPKSIRQLIQVMQPAIEKALPSVITPERFTRMALTAVSNNPRLQDCTSESFLGAMMSAAQLGLEPNTPLGQAYLIPFRNNKKGITECQFQIGYKGLIDLAHRSGEFKNITAHSVYENDVFEYEYGLEHNLVHKPALTNRGNVIAYYAVFTLVNGGSSFLVLSKEDAQIHGKRYSKSFGSGPWKDNFDEMAKKTALKMLLKYAPIKTEFARSVNQDETIKSEIKEDMADAENEMDYIDISGEEPAEAIAENVDPETGEVLFDGMTSAEADALLAEEESK